MPDSSSAKISIHDLASPDLVFCEQLADEAGKIMLQYFDADQHEMTKADGTPVTIADTTINRMVIDKIKVKFPNDEIVGEEESTAKYGMGRRWICDPIDGTKAYISGIPTSMFSIALVVDGIPRVAVTFEPHRKLTYYAVQGKGSFCNGRKLQVSQDDFDHGLIGLAPDYVKKGLIDLPFVKNLLSAEKKLAIFDGAVMRGCLVAEGRIAGYAHPNVKPWDIAAIHLIIEEAGGKITDIYGKPITYMKDFQGAILSNGTVHDNLLKLFES